MRSRGEKKKMMRRPRKLPLRKYVRHAGKGLRKFVALRLSIAIIRGPVVGELVSLVENHEVVRFDVFPAESSEHSIARERVHADDHAIASATDEWIFKSCIASSDDMEIQSEQRRQFVLPVANQAGRHDDQNPLQQAPRKHLADVEPGHDRFPRACVIREKKAQTRLLKHEVIDRDPLVWECVDARYLRSEHGVCVMPERESLSFDERLDMVRVGREIEQCRAGIRRQPRGAKEGHDQPCPTYDARPRAGLPFPKILPLVEMQMRRRDARILLHEEVRPSWQLSSNLCESCRNARRLGMRTLSRWPRPSTRDGWSSRRGTPTRCPAATARCRGFWKTIPSPNRTALAGTTGNAVRS